MCWCHLVTRNNNGRLRYGHFTRSIDSKGIDHSERVHGGHTRRGEGDIFGIMLHATSHNHQLRFGRKSANHFRRRHRIHIGSSWNCRHSAGCRFAADSYSRNHLINHILSQKAKGNTRVAGVPKSDRARTWTSHIMGAKGIPNNFNLNHFPWWRGFRFF